MQSFSLPILASGLLAIAACAQTPVANAPAAGALLIPPLSLPLSPGWQHDAVFYLAFVRSFADSTTGPRAGDGVGDIRGMIERLDYLNDGDPATTTDLGVTGLWLLPVAQSPSYHGYDTTDYVAVDDEYGSADDFRELVAACHERGIRVLVDLVLNHCSNQHPWFLKSMDPASDKRDWFVWADEAPDQKGPWGQPAWHTLGSIGHEPASPEQADDAFYGVFWHGMPDLNYHNPEVTAQMHRVADFWLTEMGVDGFRLDAIMYLLENGDTLKNDPATIAWFRDFSAHVQRVKPGAFMVGEVWDSSEQIARYIDPTQTEPPALDSCFDFPFAYAVMEGVRDGNADRIRKDLARSFEMHADRASSFLSNHDMDRSMPFMGNSVPKAKAAATLLLTGTGVPFVYYGEELGMTGQGRHENLRTPMPWTTDHQTGGFTTGEPWQPLNRDMTSVSVQAQADDDTSLLSHYRKLIGLRDGHDALRRGDLTMTTPHGTRVVAYVRTFEGQRLLVIVNTTDNAVTDFRVDASDLGLSPTAERADLLAGAAINKVLPNHPDLWRPISSIRPNASHVIALD
ncbi:MAG: alpha-amylase [Phycisphaerales bacterium]|jgi:alpha-amylase